MLSKNDSNDKEAYIKSLFSNIAPRYDFLNSILSLSLHHRWRRYCVRLCELKNGNNAMDVCCGTGDFAFELKRAVGSKGRVVGIDIAEPMVEIAKQKSKKLNLEVDFMVGKADSIPFDSNTFDAAAVGFGLRNVTDVRKAVSEMVRVVKPGGRVVSLEIGRVDLPIIKYFWKLFFCVIGPKIAKIFGGMPEAYQYLPNSVMKFLSPNELAQIFSECGLSNIKYRRLSFGAIMIHVGVK